MIRVIALEIWIRKKTGIGVGVTGVPFVEALQAYQLKKLNEVIDYVRGNTPFYRRHLASLPVAPLSILSDLAILPFTVSSDLTGDPFSFLAVRQDDVARIAALRTSGSTGEVKRLFFTDEDLELTMDFFHHGMSTLVGPGQKVAVLLPCERPDSVGDLLIRGLRRMDVHTLAYGPVTDSLHGASATASFGAHCLVDIPTQVLAVACSHTGAAIGKGNIKSVLLSTDYVPRAIAERLEEIWGCRVFKHYGMTEMALGGGVECEALDGYHLREADLYFEVVDHETGEVCPDGVTGEVVFTTLTRRGMPLIRYKTGDIGRIIHEPCPCGSSLRGMERIKGRWAGTVRLGTDCVLTLSDMDEVLLRLKALLDYRPTVSRQKDGRFCLHIDVHRTEDCNLTDKEVLHMLNNIDAIRRGIAGVYLEPPTVSFSKAWRWKTTGVVKRKIVFTDDPPVDK